MPLYRFLRYAHDEVEIIADTEVDARRRLVQWDSTYPLERSARPDSTGVLWIHERYWVDTVAIDGVPVDVIPAPEA